MLQVTSAALREPTAVAVMSDGRLVVADNSVSCVFMIDQSGTEWRLVGGCSGSGTKSSSAAHLHLINAVYCTPNDDIIVCDHRLQVLSDTLTQQQITSRDRKHPPSAAVLA